MIHDLSIYQDAIRSHHRIIAKLSKISPGIRRDLYLYTVFKSGAIAISGPKPFCSTCHLEMVTRHHEFILYIAEEFSVNRT